MLTIIAFAAMLGLAWVHTSSTTQALGERSRMMTSILSGGASEALWNIDPTAADALLASLGTDPDYLGSTIYAADGSVFARRGDPSRYGQDDVIESAPIMRSENGTVSQIGSIEVHLSPQRLSDDIRRMALAIAVIGAFALLSICTVLVLILRGVTRPIVQMTDVMTRLAAGSMDIEVPGRGREDELGRMAAAVETFQANAIAKARLEEDRIRMQDEAERARREAEETLRRSEERFRALIEHSNDMVAVVDTTGRSVYRSPRWVAGTGFADKDLGRNPLFQSLHPDDVAPALAIFDMILTQPDRQASHRSRIRHADGSLRHIAWSARNALNVPGVDGIIVNARDVTTELALEEQLQQARKLEAIGQLAGGIAHDFNNIMGAILGFAEFLVQDLPADTAQHGFAQRIMSAGRRARDLVQQILAFARKSSVERAPTDLGLIIGEAHDLLSASLPSSTEFRLETSAEPLVAEVNPAQISQVVVNLCVNASDALHGQPGSVTINSALIGPFHEDHARLAEIAARSVEHVVVSGRLRQDVPYARISVSDNGTGMEPDVLRRIFDPFFTTKRRGRGTGLGLAVVHGIVAEYGGACVVESRVGQGTAFYIYLPLVAGPAEPVATDEIAGSTIGHERLLVVDDEPLLTEMLEVGLGRLGYSVTSANDPTEALKLFARNPNMFDAVISDQIMPKLSGMALLDQLKRIRPDVPFILCTGFSDGATEESALAAGADAFFVKPVPTERLAEKIRELAAA
jgi:PAS domain S-box-containing protein